MNKKTFIVAGIVMLLIVVAVATWKYSGQTKPTEKAPAKTLPSVSVAVATTGSISRTIELDGTVEAEKIARMSSPAEGPIIGCGNPVREGDRVRKDQPIVCIGRDKTINAQLAAIKSDLTREKGELDRVKILVENGAIPGDQLEIAQARYENIKAQKARIEESRSDYVITAPWGGIVSKVMVVEGDFVPPRTPLVEIFDPASLVVRFAIPESESQNVHIGNGHSISITLDAYPGKIFPGRIIRIYPKLDPSTRTRLIEALLPKDIPMTPGLFARIKMKVETHDNVVVVPTQAIIVNVKGERTAFIIQEGKALSRQVSTGIEADGLIEITKGIKPGEQVVIAGNEKLRDAMAVKVVEKNDGQGTKPDNAKALPSSEEGRLQ